VTTRAIDIAAQANTDRIISNKKFPFLQRQGRTDLLNPDVQIGSTRRPANTNPQFATSNVILPTAGNAPRPQGFIPFNSFNQSAQKFLKTQQQINTGMKDFGDQAFLAGRRFLAFTAATSSIFAFSFALQRALADSVQFEREMIRVAQVT